MAIKVGDKVRATKQAWSNWNHGATNYDARPVQTVTRVDTSGAWYCGYIYSLSTDDDACGYHCLAFSGEGIRWERVEPLPVGLDRQESPIPIGANGMEDKRVDVPAPAAQTGSGDGKANEVPESVLAEALRITDGARQRDYGSAKTNHQRIALFWAMWDVCSQGSDEEIHNMEHLVRSQMESMTKQPDNAADVAMKMILLKIARHANTPKRDNLVDIAGYTRCISRINGFEE